MEANIISFYLQEVRKHLNATSATYIRNFISEKLKEGTSPSAALLKKEISEHFAKIDEFPEVHETEYRYQVQMSAQQGRRPAMEDRITFLPYINQLFNLPKEGPSHVLYAGVYDGHGGAKAAEYTALHLHVNLFRNPLFLSDPVKALQEAYVSTDKSFCEIARSEKDKSGATSTSIVLFDNKLVIANVGDSSAVICKRQKEGMSAKKVTFDHKASNEEEKTRVKATGGLVVWFGGWRVNGTLAVSRSIGDEPMSQQLIADPHIFQHTIDEDDDCIIIATDGLWDVFNAEQVYQFIEKWRKEHGSENDNRNVDWEENIASELVEEAMKANSKDNVTCMIIFLQRRGTPPRNDMSETVLTSKPVEE